MKSSAVVNGRRGRSLKPLPARLGSEAVQTADGVALNPGLASSPGSQELPPGARVHPLRSPEWLQTHDNHCQANTPGEKGVLCQLQVLTPTREGFGGEAALHTTFSSVQGS